MFCAGRVLGLEDVHGPHHVLPADGALAHALAALGARDHVTTLQQDAVDGRVHTHPAQEVLPRCSGIPQAWDTQYDTIIYTL